MKSWRWTVLLAVFLCAFSSRDVSAQFMTNEWVFTFGGGLSDPTGIFEEQMKLGPHASLSVGRHFNPSWLLGLRAGYFPFDAEPAWISTSGQTEGRFLVMEIDSRLMLYPESWFTPYLGLGGGGALENQVFADTTGERTVDAIRPGVSAGVGISMHSQGRLLSVYTELVYQHFLMHDGSRQWLSWTTGLRFSFGGRPF